MGYIKETFKYMFRAFWALALMCLPAAVVLGIFTKPMASLSYFIEYAETNVRGFREIFWLMFSRRAVKQVYPMILIFLTLLLGASLSLSVIERHFRTGKLGIVSPFRQMNNYILPALATIGILTFIMLLYGIIQTGVITLLHMIISGRGTPNLINIILAVIISLALFVLSVLAACSAMYWTPNMVIYGYSFRDAAASSARMLDKRTGSILIGLLLPFIIVALLESLFFFIKIKIVSIILAVILYLFLIMYVVVYVMVSMFGLSDMERRDKKKPIGGIQSGV